MPFIGFLAAAIGTTVAAWAMVWLLGRGGPVGALDHVGGKGR